MDAAAVKEENGKESAPKGSEAAAFRILGHTFNRCMTVISNDGALSDNPYLDDCRVSAQRALTLLCRLAGI
ncbi:hypothetical protein CPT75_08705 [Butyrivibrio fibrisolvens]|uniref:Uncharacterized protein n=1 Tax=Butyrivibrio fibrisolvens TaxID=831 RepID=A0A317G1E5_BUTFI|nr:hypothetical protein CPT75_08705 [Butyrivibrio fibrisolvens]